MQTNIGWVLYQSPTNLDAFIIALQREGVSVIVRSGKENVIYGLTYVDHKNKVVFNGSDLGKQYSAKAVMGSFNAKSITNSKEESLHYSKSEIFKQIQDTLKGGEWKLSPVMPEATLPYEPIPYSMKIKNKQKKKRRIKF